MPEETDASTCQRCGLPADPEEGQGQETSPEGCTSCGYLSEDELTLLEEYSSMMVYLRYEYTGIFEDYDDWEEHHRLVQHWAGLGLLETSQGQLSARHEQVAHLNL